MSVRRLGRALPCVAVAVSLAVTACSGAHGSAPVRSAPVPSARAYKCARLDVPLDHLRPDGRTVRLALERSPATDPAHRIGSLLINPGGPGDSTLEHFVGLVSELSPQLQARFDIVGFDPRGVGASDPVRCVSAPELQRYDEVAGAPTTAAGLARLRATDLAFAAGCTRRSGALLPYVGTDETARDMDSIRAAVGDPKLSYLGYSYGTLLGATYAQLFPTRVRALVLDGAVDPALSPLTSATVQAQGFQRALAAFLDYCRRQSACTWRPGSGPAAALHRLLRRLSAHPLPNVLDGRRVGSGDAFTAVLISLYDPRSWPGLGEALHEAEQGDGTALLVLADRAAGRNLDGTYSNEQEASTAIVCADLPALPDTTAVVKAAAAAARVAPDVGRGNVLGLLQCADWPVHSRTRSVPSAAGSPPILVIGSTRDPATPYSEAQGLARELRHGVLLTRVGDGHTAYAVSACIRARADAYLLTLALPAPRDRTCPS